MRYGPGAKSYGELDLGVEVEKSLDTLTQLVLDLFPASLEHVHGHMRLFSVLQRYQGIAHFDGFLGRKQSHAIDQCQISHAVILRGRVACIVPAPRRIKES